MFYVEILSIIKGSQNNFKKIYKQKSLRDKYVEDGK